MLVLSRRTNESIMIGQEVVVTVLEVRGDTVRLGITAPRTVDVHREEIFLALEQASHRVPGPLPAQLEPLAVAVTDRPARPPRPRPAALSPKPLLPE